MPAVVTCGVFPLSLSQEPGWLMLLNSLAPDALTGLWSLSGVIPFMSQLKKPSWIEPPSPPPPNLNLPQEFYVTWEARMAGQSDSHLFLARLPLPYESLGNRKFLRKYIAGENIWRKPSKCHVINGNQKKESGIAHKKGRFDIISEASRTGLNVAALLDLCNCSFWALWKTCCWKRKKEKRWQG